MGPQVADRPAQLKQMFLLCPEEAGNLVVSDTGRL